MRLPNDTERIAILGRTGSGKTQAGVWHLSMRDHHLMPWIVFDWKRDKLIAKIPGIQRLKDLKRLPTKPGIYVVSPLPNQEAEVEAYLWAIWENENIGIYVDEGYMLGKSEAYRAIQTQGRSKHIPTITLSQRPVAMDRFVFSEADFYQVFALNDLNDRKRIAEWMPVTDDAGNRYDPKATLPRFHSWYYDIKENELCVLKPVPSERIILENFNPDAQTRIIV